jgi:stage V sporulation protein B
MSPYAFSTVLEQSVRIFTVLLLAQFLLPYGVEYAAAGAMIGMVIGEFVGMAYLIYSFKKDPNRPRFRLPKKTCVAINEIQEPLLKRFGKTAKDLLRLAVPVTASRLVGSFSYAIEPIAVAQSLAMAGFATSTATALYGQLEGMAIPLTFFPAFITYALSVSLVPAISEAAAQKNRRLVEHRMQQAIRLSFIVTVPCALLLYLLAEPLSILLYRQTVVARLIQIMAPFTVIHALQGPFASVLQGLDQAQAPMRNSIIGAVVKTVLILLLASKPELGIDGVALAINSGIVIVTGLHFLDIVRLVSFSIRVRDLVKLGLAVAITGLAAHKLGNLTEKMSLLSHTVFMIGTSFLIYLVCLVLLSLIRKKDVIRIPIIGKWMAYVLPR